jgi:hypothetical protein
MVEREAEGAEADLAVVLMRLSPWSEWRFIILTASGPAACGRLTVCPPGASPAEAQRQVEGELRQAALHAPKLAWVQTDEGCWVGRPLLH